MLSQKLFVDARIVVEAVDIGLGTQIHQVFVAGFVLGVKAKVEALTGAFVAKLLLVVEIGLHPDDRFDTLFLHLLVEIDRTEHIAVIGNGDRIHPQLFEPASQSGYLVGTVEQRIFGMQMQMRESGFHTLVFLAINV